MTVQPISFKLKLVSELQDSGTKSLPQFEVRKKKKLSTFRQADASI
jgi:hypothetical protein